MKTTMKNTSNIPFFFIMLGTFQEKTKKKELCGMSCVYMRTKNKQTRRVK